MTLERYRSLRSLIWFSIMLLTYACLVLTAYFLYPGSFSPLTNTLAQLGDPRLNPSGAIFYYAGVFIICGSTFFVAIALLFLPKHWLTNRGAKRRRIFYLTVFFMVAFTLFYLLSALVPASLNYGFNLLFTFVFLVSLELFILFSAMGVGKLKNHLRWVPWFGFAIVGVNILLVLATATTGLAVFGWILAVMSWSYTVSFIYEFSSTIFVPQPQASLTVQTG